MHTIALSTLLRGLWSLALVLLLVSPLKAQTPQSALWHDDAAIAELFRQAGVQGTFVVFDPLSNTISGTQYARASTRFSPASTFKIPHALIGLSLGVVRDVDELIPYRSALPPFSPAWVRDMGLHDAMTLSNVPIFQELARRIGSIRMQEALRQLAYGSMSIGGLVDRFWLDGTLTISALEQIRFLQQIAEGNLLFPAIAQGQVRTITVFKRTPSWVLHAKTGWQNAPGPGIGWWVGWVERNGAIYPFALNIDIRTAADAPLRQRIGLDALRIRQLID